MEHALIGETLHGPGEASEAHPVAGQDSARAPLHPGLEQVVDIVERTLLYHEFIFAVEILDEELRFLSCQKRIGGGKVQHLGAVPTRCGIVCCIVCLTGARVEASVGVR